MSRSTFHIGRLILASLMLLHGLQTFTTGDQHLLEPLHALRHKYIPASTTQSKAFGLEISYDLFFVYAIKALAALQLLAGLLILLNRKCMGSTLIILTVLVTVLLKDCPITGH